MYYKNQNTKNDSIHAFVEGLSNRLDFRVLHIDGARTIVLTHVAVFGKTNVAFRFSKMRIKSYPWADVTMMKLLMAWW